MSNKKRFISMMMRSVLLTITFLLAGASIVLADDTQKFVPGTKVNGVLVGGMTIEEAKVQIEGFYGSVYNLTLQEKDGKSEVINGTDIDYQNCITDGLQEILDEQNANGRLAGPAINHSHTIQGKASYNEEKLASIMSHLSCVSGDKIVVTANARITDWKEGEPFTIIPEVQGNSVNTEKLTESVKAALNAGSKSVNLLGTGCYDTVTIAKDNADLVARCNLMNRYRGMEITYTFGEQTEVLNGDTICQWITGTTNQVVDVDVAKAGAYIKGLADKYDTAGKARVFHTAVGRDVTLSGAYGWQMNQQGETAALIAMIRTGQPQSRVPLYLKAAADRNIDWGTTYIEVDLAGQHVYMFQNGQLAWDAPCVTGNVAKNHTTPAGIYTLTYKQTNRVLRGPKKADGTFTYQSHVDYWMPFNGGIGLHDANWRSRFGGTIYKNSGSHGCINLPPKKAKALYGLVYKGIPVICHN
jgi:hypothetical protein